MCPVEVLGPSFHPQHCPSPCNRDPEGPRWISACHNNLGDTVWSCWGLQACFFSCEIGGRFLAMPSVPGIPGTIRGVLGCTALAVHLSPAVPIPSLSCPAWATSGKQFHLPGSVSSPTDGTDVSSNRMARAWGVSESSFVRGMEPAVWSSLRRWRVQ